MVRYVLCVVALALCCAWAAPAEAKYAVAAQRARVAEGDEDGETSPDEHVTETPKEPDTPTTPEGETGGGATPNVPHPDGGNGGTDTTTDAPGTEGGGNGGAGTPDEPSTTPDGGDGGAGGGAATTGAPASEDGSMTLTWAHAPLLLVAALLAVAC